MSQEPGIQSDKGLEFAVFCIENIAQQLKVNAQRVYATLTEKSDILHTYIVPGYDILHTQSKDYIVDDILQVMREKGITLGMTANPILLQKKYARVVEAFAEKAGLTLDAALDFFYRSETYRLISEGVSDLHCMSDAYLTDELMTEYQEKTAPESTSCAPVFVTAK